MFECVFRCFICIINFEFQGLNPGLAIGEMKKMLAKYDANKAKEKAAVA